MPNDIPRRQRTTIRLQVVILILTLAFFAWSIQADRLHRADNQIIHAENELSKVERKANRLAIEALAVRVTVLEKASPAGPGTGKEIDPENPGEGVIGVVIPSGPAAGYSEKPP